MKQEGRKLVQATLVLQLYRPNFIIISSGLSLILFCSGKKHIFKTKLLGKLKADCKFYLCVHINISCICLNYTANHLKVNQYL